MQIENYEPKNTIENKEAEKANNLDNNEKQISEIEAMKEEIQKKIEDIDEEIEKIKDVRTKNELKEKLEAIKSTIEEEKNNEKIVNLFNDIIRDINGIRQKNKEIIDFINKNDKLDDKINEY